MAVPIEAKPVPNAAAPCSTRSATRFLLPSRMINFPRRFTPVSLSSHRFSIFRSCSITSRDLGALATTVAPTPNLRSRARCRSASFFDAAEDTVSASNPTPC